MTYCFRLVVLIALASQPSWASATNDLESVFEEVPLAVLNVPAAPDTQTQAARTQTTRDKLRAGWNKFSAFMFKLIVDPVE